MEKDIYCLSRSKQKVIGEKDWEQSNSESQQKPIYMAGIEALLAASQAFPASFQALPVRSKASPALPALPPALPSSPQGLPTLPQAFLASSEVLRGSQRPTGALPTPSMDPNSSRTEQIYKQTYGWINENKYSRIL